MNEIEIGKNGNMQVKVEYDSGESEMHVQCVTKEVVMGRNRHYGYSVKIKPHEQFFQWLREQDAVLRSAASDRLLYTPFELIEYQNGDIQMYVPGKPANHPQGAVLDLSPSDERVKNLIVFAKKAGLIKTVDHPERWTPSATMTLQTWFNGDVFDTLEEEE
tara:strand:+ start:821 stop:1303 length:483 start_codon:yes stop_codon:yes gene_type:complete